MRCLLCRGKSRHPTQIWITPNGPATLWEKCEHYHRAHGSASSVEYPDKHAKYMREYDEGAHEYVLRGRQELLMQRECGGHTNMHDGGNDASATLSTLQSYKDPLTDGENLDDSELQYSLSPRFMFGAFSNGQSSTGAFSNGQELKKLQDVELSIFRTLVRMHRCDEWGDLEKCFALATGQDPERFARAGDNRKTIELIERILDHPENLKLGNAHLESVIGYYKEFKVWQSEGTPYLGV